MPLGMAWWTRWVPEEPKGELCRVTILCGLFRGAVCAPSLKRGSQNSRMGASSVMLHAGV